MLPPRWSGWLGKILLSTNYLWEGCLYNPMMARYSHVPKTKVTLPSPEFSFRMGIAGGSLHSSLYSGFLAHLL